MSGSDHDQRDFDSAQRYFPQSPREAIEPEPAPEPPKRKREGNPLLLVVNGAMSLVMFLIIALGAGLYIGKLRYESPGPATAATSVMVERGDGTATIANRLKSAGVIEEPLVFRAAVSLLKADRDLKAGEYLFEPRASVANVIDTLVSGRAVLHQITIPEGLTTWQIVERLKAEPLLQGEIAPMPVEGALLPETYKFTRGMSRMEIIERMKTAHDKVVAEAWERRKDDLPIATPEEMVILASIVEKETGRADERNRVAGVFVNRLNKGMRLQSDPTIIYGITEGKGKLGRGIRRSEIDQVTAYNTYQIDGLPPTPIANPGRASIEAVANPSRTDDIFFVADGTGGHAFAVTLDDHNANVRRWREIEAQRAAAAAEAEASDADAATDESSPSN